MSVNNLRAILERLVAESDYPEIAAVFAAAALEAVMWHGDKPLTDAERQLAARIDAAISQGGDALAVLVDQIANEDWQTSKTTIGKPGITH